MPRFVARLAIVLGLVSLLAAAGVRWVAAPRLAVLPSDLNASRTYTGTATTLFNEKALSSADAGPVLLTNVPVTLGHTTKVLETKGDNALVEDAGTVEAGGSTVAGYSYRYAVNRTSMDQGSGFSDVVKQQGVTFNWPIRTEKRDYTGWVSDTQTTIPLEYGGTDRRGGLSTYVFTTTSQATPITDPQTLQALPTSLPKATFIALSASLGLAPAELEGLQQVLAAQTDPVPLSYTYKVTATYWVEPATGEIVDLNAREVRTLVLKAGSTVVPITPIIDISYTSSPSELAAAVKDAERDAGLVNLGYRTVPIALLIVGVLLLAVGGVLVALRRSRRGPNASEDSGRPAAVTPETASAGRSV
jgi:hypothetical protein